MLRGRKEKIPSNIARAYDIVKDLWKIQKCLWKLCGISEENVRE
jgi:hypothetical protein